MNNTEEYFVCWSLAQAFEKWDQGQREYFCKHFGVQIEDVLAIKLQMIKRGDLPSYVPEAA